MGKRIFRVLVCLFLVCCILVNISPIKAKASFAISGTAALIWAALASAGVVFAVESASDVQVLDDALQEWADKTLTTDEEWESYKNFVNDFNNNFFNEPDAPDPGNRGLLAKIAGTVFGSVLATFIYGAIKDNAVEVQGEAAPEGFSYYGENLFPTLNNFDSLLEQYGYACIVDSTLPYIGNYLYFTSVQPLRTVNDRGVEILQIGGNGSFKYACYNCPVGKSSWSYYGGNGNYTGVMTYVDVYWTSYDSSTSINSKPTSSKTKEITPIYVGDIPSQVQNGSLSADAIPLPDTIDLSTILTSPDTLTEDLKSLSQGLKDGSVTYNDYVTNITYIEKTEPDTTEPTEPSTGTDPDPNPDPDPEDPEQDPEPEEGISNFTLDLKDYFPFCIPFDLYDFVSCLNAAPEAPVIEWEIYTSGGGSYPLVLDLSPFDSAAQLLRRLELLLFCIGLGFVTRNLIKG